MEKIYLIVACLLLLLLIFLGIYSAVRFNMDSRRIEELKKENNELVMRISSAEALISVQNERIKQHAVDMKQAENVYMGKLASIEEKYRKLKSVKLDNNKCETLMDAVYKNQERFCNAR